MNARGALDIAQMGIQIAIMVSLPTLIVTLFIGLAVSIFQAMTQVHEMTLTYVPKLLGVAVVLGFTGNWILQKLVGFMILCFENISRVSQ
ncbi:MAG: flagellar biosynthetic protein FliQ [Fimbriimonadaceae bacterium]|nr:flagellar biosynthetic protein FliQ [Fimbriimonadaceae bacterium]